MKTAVRKTKAAVKRAAKARAATPVKKAATPAKSRATPTSQPVPDAVKARIAQVTGRGLGPLGHGPFKPTKLAMEAKTPAALRLRAGSARWALMEFAFAHPKGFTREELAQVLGPQTGQALTGMALYGFIGT